MPSTPASGACIAGADQPASITSLTEGGFSFADSRSRRARWRKWAEEQLDRLPVGASPPPGEPKGMSAEVAAAVEQQAPFMRRPPAEAAAAAETAPPATDGHVPAEVVAPDCSKTCFPNGTHFLVAHALDDVQRCHIHG